STVLPTAVFVNEVEDPCLNGNKVFSANVVDYCDGLNKSVINYPGKFYVSYDSGVTKYPIGIITSYNDLITQLNAEPNKPANFTFQPNANPILYNVQIQDDDCDQTDTSKLYLDQDSYLA